MSNKKQKSKKPNIVLFVAEDLDYEGLNCYDATQTGRTGLINAGNPNMQDTVPFNKQLTPTIDSLARDGVKFTNYYCASAICTPARYTIMTGRYPERSSQLKEYYPDGTQANIWFEADITKTETILPKVLKSAGYTTGIVGKWHNYPLDLDEEIKDLTIHKNKDATDPNDPEVKANIDRGYELAVNHLVDGFGWDFVDRIYFNNCEPTRPKPLNSNNTEWIIEGALDFLDNEIKEDPFFLYVAINSPHGRYDKKRVEEDPRGTIAGLLDEAPDVMPSRENVLERSRSAGLAEDCAEGVWLDDSVNAVIKKLKEIGVDEDTLFIFTTDHPSAGKGTCHLGRIPLIIKWSGQIPAAQVENALLAQTDLAPTILDLAGCDIPEDMQLDGHSFKKLMFDRDNYGERDSALLEVVNSRAVVSGEWKYIANRLPADGSCSEENVRTLGWFGKTLWADREKLSGPVRWRADEYFPHYFAEDQLYNLEEDPLEQNNLADDLEYASVLEEMREKLKIELQNLPHTFGQLNRDG